MCRVIAVLLFVLSPIVSTAADLNLGDYVFVRHDAEATIDGAKVDTNTIPVPAKIVEIGEDRVSLERVWVRKSDVLTADEALVFFNEQIRNEPKNSKSFVGRGMVRAIQKELNKALADFDEAIKLDSMNAKAYRGRGGVWARKSQWDNAFNDFTEAIRLDPQDAKSYANRGYWLAAMGRFDPSIQDSTEAIRLDPKSTTAYRTRAGILFLKAEFENAIRDLTEAITLDQTDLSAYLLIASLKASCPDDRLRNGKEAVEYANKACELCDWNVWQCLAALAAAYAEAGDFPNATRWAEKSLELAPENQKQPPKELLELFRANKPYRFGPQTPLIRQFL